ncbi:nuclear transport factor 2 family protein [uncultured Arcticibacterium sp.]|uniref:nuclear transport factor 2 family protein n=1 Tax=uncultured Arcticibacterium sp. TaxID=2173042 RepID=UPI0030FC0E13
MENLLEKFYTAFSKQDAETMASCYHKDVVFEDPAFGKLHGKDAGDMWRMLCKNGKDLEITFSEPIADEEKGLVKWEAKYTFSQTGRSVHNIVLAKFKFKDGKIIEHTDTFNLYAWAKQAMGFKGILLGNTQFFKKKLNQTTTSTLKKFQEKL